MGAQWISPDFDPMDRRVTKAADLWRLEDAEAVIVGSGQFRVVFDGDEVRDVSASKAASDREWAVPLRAAKTRREVFEVLAAYIRRPGFDERLDVVRPLAWDVRRRVSIVPSVEPEDRTLLDKYDYWIAILDEEDGGITGMYLTFEEGVLRKVQATEYPFAP